MSHLFNDVLLVIIPQCPAQLVVIHAGSLLQFPPLFGNFFLVCQLKFTMVLPSPGNNWTKSPIFQQFQQKFPQMDCILIAGSWSFHRFVENVKKEDSSIENSRINSLYKNTRTLDCACVVPVHTYFFLCLCCSYACAYVAHMLVLMLLICLCLCCSYAYACVARVNQPLAT